MDGFMIFGYMVWVVVTVAAWIVGMGATFAGAGDGDGEMFLGGVVIWLAGMLSSSFLIAQLN